MAYSHPAFYEAAVSALKTWRFKPAQIHGFPRSATAILDFTFRTEGVVVNLTTNNIPEIIHYRITPGSLSYRACTLRDLDKIPTPTKIVRPVYTPEQARRSHVRHVTVEFYIDEQGRVRQPAVARQADEADEEPPSPRSSSGSSSRRSRGVVRSWCSSSRTSTSRPPRRPIADYSISCAS